MFISLDVETLNLIFLHANTTPKPPDCKAGFSLSLFPRSHGAELSSGSRFRDVYRGRRVRGIVVWHGLYTQWEKHPSHPGASSRRTFEMFKRLRIIRHVVPTQELVAGDDQAEVVLGHRNCARWLWWWCCLASRLFPTSFPLFLILSGSIFSNIYILKNAGVPRWKSTENPYDPYMIEICEPSHLGSRDDSVCNQI